MGEAAAVQGSWWRAEAVRRGVTAHDPSPALRLFELLAVTAVAVTQPLLDVFSKSADVFVLRGAGPLEVVAFAAVVALGPPVVAWLGEALVGLVSRRAMQVLHMLVLSTFAVLIMIQLLKAVTDQGWRRILVASLVLGPLLVAIVVTVSALRTWLRLLAVFPFVLLSLFILASPVSDVVFPDDVRVADAAVTRPAPVVQIVLDELPTSSLLDAEGQVDGALFPNFAALAESSTWYRNHTTVAPATVEAVPAILTGRWPRLDQGLPTYANHPENLFSLLGGAYDLHVGEIATELCSSDRCGDRQEGALGELLEDALDVWTSRASPKPTKRILDFDVGGAHGADDVRASELERFTADLGRSTSRRRLDFIHTLLPHGGWTFLASGARYVAPHPPDGNVFYIWTTDHAARAARARHLLQVQYTDRLIGEVLDRLRELGTYDDSLIVVTADHGVSFRGGNHMRVANTETYPDIVWTPLFVKAPGQSEGEVVDAPARSIDVLPTIAEHLGIEIPWHVDGRSLVGPAREDRDVRILRSALAHGGDEDGDYLIFDREDGYSEVLSSGPRVPDDPLGVYRIEPFGGLIGLPVEALEVEGGDRLRARLQRPGTLHDVDPDAAVLPVYFAGEATAEHPVDVAVVLNGVVAGWCETTDRAGVGDTSGTESYPFWAVVPESLLGPGRNEVELYELRREDRGPLRLRRMALDQA